MTTNSLLEADYMATHGSGLKELHDAFLRGGAQPIPLVRRLLLGRPRS
jgi:hypothetical protein